MSKHRDPRRLNPNVAKLVDAERPVHRPKHRLPHLADEYEGQGNHVLAAELRRHLLGTKGRAAQDFLTVLTRRGSRGH